MDSKRWSLVSCAQQPSFSFGAFWCPLRAEGATWIPSQCMVPQITCLLMCGGIPYKCKLRVTSLSSASQCIVALLLCMCVALLFSTVLYHCGLVSLHLCFSVPLTLPGLVDKQDTLVYDKCTYHLLYNVRVVVGPVRVCNWSSRTLWAKAW